VGLFKFIPLIKFLRKPELYLLILSFSEVTEKNSKSLNFTIQGKVYMQALVRFYAYYRIKQHASLRLLRNRLIFLFSALMPYSQGGMVIALATLSSILKRNKINPFSN